MENELLNKSINEILVVYHYRDTRTSSEDDITRDYYYLCYNGDKYLQELIEEGLSNLKGRIERSCSFHTIYLYDYDPSALSARSPREACYMNLKDIERIRVWLLELATKKHSIEKHEEYLKSTEYAERKKLLSDINVIINNENRSIYTYCNTNGEGFIENESKPIFSYNYLVLDEQKDEEKCKNIFKHLYCSDNY
jgi:hypothetical protein